MKATRLFTAYFLLLAWLCGLSAVAHSQEPDVVQRGGKYINKVPPPGPAEGDAAKPAPPVKPATPAADDPFTQLPSQPGPGKAAAPAEPAAEGAVVPRSTGAQSPALTYRQLESVQEPHSLAPDTGKTTKVCDIVQVAENTAMMLVLDENGKIMNEVRGILIVVPHRTPPWVRLVSYPGLYEPANPELESRLIRKMHAIPYAEFQKLLAKDQSSSLSSTNRN